MKKQSLRLLLFTLLMLFLFGSNILASRPSHLAQDCKQGCTQSRDGALMRCNGLSGDDKTKCQDAANERYNKCVENCNTDRGNSGNRGSGDGGKKP